MTILLSHSQVFSKSINPLDKTFWVECLAIPTEQVFSCTCIGCSSHRLLASAAAVLEFHCCFFHHNAVRQKQQKK
jgi:hypothetical protein